MTRRSHGSLLSCLDFLPPGWPSWALLSVALEKGARWCVDSFRCCMFFFTRFSLHSLPLLHSPTKPNPTTSSPLKPSPLTHSPIKLIKLPPSLHLLHFTPTILNESIYRNLLNFVRTHKHPLSRSNLECTQFEFKTDPFFNHREWVQQKKNWKMATKPPIKSY